jgi:hypothetical protein
MPLERSRLLMLIGLVAAEWSALEERMALLYGYLVGQRGPAEEYGQPVDETAVNIFYELEARHQRQRLLRSIACMRMGTPKAYAELSEALDLVDKASHGRNDLMHTPLVVSDLYPSSLVAAPLVGEMREIDEQFVEETLKEIEQARLAISHAEQVARRQLQGPRTSVTIEDN